MNSVSGSVGLVNRSVGLVNSVSGSVGLVNRSVGLVNRALHRVANGIL